MDVQQLKSLRKQLLIGFSTFATIFIILAIGLHNAYYIEPRLPPLPTPTPIATPLATPSPEQSPTPVPNILADKENRNFFTLYVLGAISALGALGTFAGVISTTVLAWKKEAREAEEARLERELKAEQLREMRRKNETEEKKKGSGNNRKKKR